MIEEKKWTPHPSGINYELEDVPEGTCFGWQRAIKGWKSDKFWFEVNTITGEKRWRKVDIDSNGEPLSLDDHGNPKTLSIHYKEPVSEREIYKHSTMRALLS